MVDGEPRYYLEIPKIGSLIARNSFDKPVPGTRHDPAGRATAGHPHPSRLPDHGRHRHAARPVRPGVLVPPPARPRPPRPGPWFLRFAVVAGPLAVVALEAGWIATEVGRQPWVVYGVLRTTDAAGDSPWIWWSLTGTVVVYAGLTVGRRRGAPVDGAAAGGRGEHDLPSPYGPEATMTLELAVAAALFAGVRRLRGASAAPTSAPGSSTRRRAVTSAAPRCAPSSTTASARCGRRTTSG